jgi:hypothetical protein
VRGNRTPEAFGRLLSRIKRQTNAAINITGGSSFMRVEEPLTMDCHR